MNLDSYARRAQSDRSGYPPTPKPPPKETRRLGWWRVWGTKMFSTIGSPIMGGWSLFVGAGGLAGIMTTLLLGDSIERVAACLYWFLAALFLIIAMASLMTFAYGCSPGSVP